MDFPLLVESEIHPYSSIIHNDRSGQLLRSRYSQEPRTFHREWGCINGDRGICSRLPYRRTLFSFSLEEGVSITGLVFKRIARLCELLDLPTRVASSMSTSSVIASLFFEFIVPCDRPFLRSGMGISMLTFVDRVSGFLFSETALLALALTSVWASVSISNSAIVIAGATVALWCSSFRCSVSWIWFVVWMTFCWTVSLSITGWMVSWTWLSKKRKQVPRPL